MIKNRNKFKKKTKTFLRIFSESKINNERTWLLL